MAVRPSTPAQAWKALTEGNARFAAGKSEHPHQDEARRGEVASGQAPYAVTFSCSDSRVPVEILFDQGLGDIFPVRNAGHVIEPGALGSIEFGVDLLSTPLVVVLGHQNCGAVGAARTALTTGEAPENFIRSVIDAVIPSLVTGHGTDAHSATVSADLADYDSIVDQHVKATMRNLLVYSPTTKAAVDSGACAVVGARYSLDEGTVTLVDVIGNIEN